MQKSRANNLDSRPSSLPLLATQDNLDFSPNIEKMKTLTCKYRPVGKTQILSDMKAAIAERPKVEPDIIYFENLELIDLFITPMKAKINRAIHGGITQSQLRNSLKF